jgi:quercetin dioxygenase-like cupin family protein
MRHRTVLLAALTSLFVPGMAAADSTLLDLERLNYETVYVAAQRTVLALDNAGRPLTALLRIAKGQFLPPHGAEGGLRVLTVLSGTLSWGDGAKVDLAAERRFGPGSVIIVPAAGGEHWAAARQDDVLLQIVMVRQGKLAPEAAAQLER